MIMPYEIYHLKGFICICVTGLFTLNTGFFLITQFTFLLKRITAQQQIGENIMRFGRNKDEFSTVSTDKLCYASDANSDRV